MSAMAELPDFQFFLFVEMSEVRFLIVKVFNPLT